MATGIIIGYILGVVLHPLLSAIPSIVETKLNVFAAKASIELAEAAREVGKIENQVEEISTFRIVEGTNVADEDDDYLI